MAIGRCDLAERQPVRDGLSLTSRPGPGSAVSQVPRARLGVGGPPTIEECREQQSEVRNRQPAAGASCIAGVAPQAGRPAA